MKSDESKEARLLALLNAATMIEQHGEEGGIEQEEYDIPVALYLREKKRVAKLLFAMAEKYKAKHQLP